MKYFAASRRRASKPRTRRRNSLERESAQVVRCAGSAGAAEEQENVDRRLRNRIVIFLALAGVLAYGLVWLSGRKPAAKISAVTPRRENLISSISSNGKVEPIAPYVMRAQLDTFVEKVCATEGQTVKK